MLCLSCEQESATAGPDCPHCGAYLGNLAEGQGFLPQLKALEEQLHRSQIEPEEGDLRLNRLERALELMTYRLDQSGHSLATGNLDELQQATLAGFLGPLRGALEASRALVHDLPVETPWPDETWAQLRQWQEKITLGYKALGLLSQLVAHNAREAGFDPRSLQQG